MWAHNWAHTWVFFVVVVVVAHSLPLYVTPLSSTAFPIPPHPLAAFPAT